MTDPIDIVGPLLRSIQADLRELKFTAEVDRKNARSSFDHLVSEVGATLGLFEAKLTHQLGEMNARLDQLTGQFDQSRAEVNVQLEALRTQLDRIEQAVTKP
jgi:stress response protein SCP2